MTFQEERDEAAGSRDYSMYHAPFNYAPTERPAFKSGANWALQSQLVKQMAEALEFAQQKAHSRQCMEHPVIAASHSYECDEYRNALTTIKEKLGV